MFIWIILIVLIVLMLGSAPTWPHSRRWGYSPIAIVGLLLVVFMCIWMFGGFSSWGHHAWWGGGHMDGPSTMRP